MAEHFVCAVTVNLLNKIEMGEILKDLKELLEERKFESLDDANRFLKEFTGSKNRAPVDDLGGLSPIQMHNLLYTPVDSVYSPVAVNKNLNESELANSLFYRDSKKFLELFEKESPVKTTITGNLNRKFISKAMEITDFDISDILKYCKVINELDFFWLHRIRIIFTLAGLIRKRTGSFSITTKGEKYLKKPPGELFYLLFYTYFYKFNLAYYDCLPEWPEIQDTINFSLFMAREHCNDWMSPEELTEITLVRGLRLDRKYSEYLSKPYNDDDLVWAYRGRFIETMINFGLFETQEERKTRFLGKSKIRRTPLLEKFINFHFENISNP